MLPSQSAMLMMSALKNFPHWLSTYCTTQAVHRAKT